MIIDVDIAATDVLRVLERLDTAFSVAGLTEFMRGQALPYLASRARGRFSSEGDDASGPWRSLARSTEGRRERSGYPPAHPINIQSGEMYDYITRAPGTIIADPAGVSAHFPHRGAHPARVKHKINQAQAGNRRQVSPARPVLVVGQQDVNQIATLLTGHMARFIGGGRQRTWGAA